MGTIAVLVKLDEAELARIRSAAPGWNVLSGESVTAETVRESDILLGWREAFSPAVLDASSKVSWIQTWSAGVDSLPVEALQGRGVEITSANGVHANPISETIFAMLLAFTRKLHVYVRNQLERKWHHSGLRLELHGKTIGIAGVGAIGEETARIAKAAFGMRVIGMRRSGAPAPHVDEMYGAGTQLQWLPECDYVVSIMPATNETKHVFGAQEFAVMKRTAFFVNVGRGSAVDTEALVAALRDGEIAGAGLDVFEQEPLPPEHPLWGMENVIITPHSAGSTELYSTRALDIFLKNLEQVLRGKPPAVNRLSPQKGY